MATAPGTLKANDKQITEDDIVMQAISGNRKALAEIDFGHQKQALVFAQHKGA